MPTGINKPLHFFVTLETLKWVAAHGLHARLCETVVQRWATQEEGVTFGTTHLGGIWRAVDDFGACRGIVVSGPCRFEVGGGGDFAPFVFFFLLSGDDCSLKFFVFGWGWSGISIPIILFFFNYRGFLGILFNFICLRNNKISPLVHLFLGLNDGLFSSLLNRRSAPISFILSNLLFMLFFIDKLVQVHFVIF